MSKYLKVAIGAIITIFVVIYVIALIPSEDPNRTNEVFVYDSLTNPIVRAFVCRCRTSAESMLWEGYTLVDGQLTPHQTNSIKGKLLKLNATELKLLDIYHDAPKSTNRKEVKIDNKRVFVYLDK